MIKGIYLPEYKGYDEDIDDLCLDEEWEECDGNKKN